MCTCVRVYMYVYICIGGDPESMHMQDGHCDAVIQGHTPSLSCHGSCNPIDEIDMLHGSPHVGLLLGDLCTCVYVCLCVCIFLSVDGGLESSTNTLVPSFKAVPHHDMQHPYCTKGAM